MRAGSGWARYDPNWGRCVGNNCHYGKTASVGVDMARFSDGSASLMRHTDSHKKSVAKAISWRLLGSMVIFTSVYVFTGEEALSIKLTMVDIILKLVLYYFHERVWMRFRF